jgi:hypothetical protein
MWALCKGHDSVSIPTILSAWQCQKQGLCKRFSLEKVVHGRFQLQISGLAKLSGESTVHAVDMVWTLAIAGL